MSQPERATVLPLALKRISSFATVELFVALTLASSCSLVGITMVNVSNNYPTFQLNQFADHMISGTAFVAIPMIMELYMDRKLHRSITLPRLLLLISFPVTALLMLFGNYYWLLCGMFTRELCLRNSLLCNMFHDRREFTPTRRVIYLAILVVFCVDMNVRLSIVFRNFIKPVGTTGPILTGMSVLYVLTLFLFAFVVYRIMKGNMSAAVQGTIRGGEKHCVYYSLLLVLSMVIKLLLRAIVSTFVHHEELRLNYMIVGHGIMDISLCVLASVIPSRIARHDFDLAQHLIDTKKRFIRFLSYEYRISLNTIIAGVEQAQSLTLEPMLQIHRIQNHLNGTKAACQVACSLLDNVLFFNEMEDGKVAIHKAPCLISGLLHMAIVPMLQKAAHKGVAVVYDEAEIQRAVSGVVVDVDQFKLCNVIRNFVTYAIDRTIIGEGVDVICFVKPREERMSPFGLSNDALVHPGDMEEGLVIADGSLNDYVRIEVHDRGHGLFEDQGGDIFSDNMIEHYMSGSTTSSGEMGLWVAKAIVELHKGSIGMVSVDGKGTVLYVEIPIVDIRPYSGNDKRTDHIDEDDEDEDDNARPITTAVYKDQANTTYDFTLSDVCINRALIASHRPDIVTQLTKAMNGRVADIVLAASDVQAVSEIREAMDNFDRFSIVFLDRDLPGRYVYVVLSRLRKLGYTGVAALVSCKDFMDTNSRFLSCGGDAVLYEPVTDTDVEMTLMDAHYVSLKSDREYIVRRLEQRLKDKHIREQRLPF